MPKEYLSCHSIFKKILTILQPHDQQRKDEIKMQQKDHDISIRPLAISWF